MSSTNTEAPAGDSFLRRVDARTKLALALLVSSAIMLELPALVAVCVAFALLVQLAGIGRQVRAQIRRIRWLLAILLVLDWIVVGPEVAIAVTLRLALLVSAFQLVMATTRPDELHRALLRLGFPEPVVLSLAVAQRTLSDLEIEWRRILEAQRARGLDFDGGSQPQRLRRWWSQSFAITVPAIVLATKRAWATHEAAAVRGFGSPPLNIDSSPLPIGDRVLLAASLAAFALLALGR